MQLCAPALGSLKAAAAKQLRHTWGWLNPGACQDVQGLLNQVLPRLRPSPTALVQQLRQDAGQALRVRKRPAYGRRTFGNAVQPGQALAACFAHARRRCVSVPRGLCAVLQPAPWTAGANGPEVGSLPAVHIRPAGPRKAVVLSRREGPACGAPGMLGALTGAAR